MTKDDIQKVLDAIDELIDQRSTADVENGTRNDVIEEAQDILNAAMLQ